MKLNRLCESLKNRRSFLASLLPKFGAKQQIDEPASTQPSPSRRDILKAGVAGLVSSQIPLPVAQKPISAADAAKGHTMLWQLIEYTYHRKNNTDELISMAKRHGATPQMVIAAIKAGFAGPDCGNMLEVSDMADGVDWFTGGAYSAELDGMIKREGPVGVARKLIKYVCDDLQDIEIGISRLQQLGEKYQSIDAMFPSEMLSNALAGDYKAMAQTLQHFEDSGVASRAELERAWQHIEHWKEYDDSPDTDPAHDQDYDEDDALRRWEGEGGLTFEERLSAILM